jgi:hypothetical protein
LVLLILLDISLRGARMPDKREVNVMYQAHHGDPVKHYDGPEGVVWISQVRRPDIPNVSLSWYANRKPKPGDSMFVLEPMCVTPKDYSMDFLRRFKHIFTWATRALEGTAVANKIVPVRHPSCLQTPNVEHLIERWKPWNERKDQIVIIANKKTSQHPSEIYRLRLMLAEWLDTNSKYEVVWYGHSQPSRSFSKGRIEDKAEVLSNVKFSICTENCYDPKYSWGYFTEKMPDVWKSGAVPIYMGCYNIDDFGFGKNSYIDLRKYVDKKGKQINVKYAQLRSAIEKFDEAQYNQLSQEVADNMRSPTGLFHVISYPEVYRKMLKVLCK